MHEKRPRPQAAFVLMCRSDSLTKFIWGSGGAFKPPFHPPPPPRVSFFHVFHGYSMTKLLALSPSVPVPVTLYVSLQGRGGVLLWFSAFLIHPPPPISKLEPKISDICIEKISLWPLEPLSAMPPP